ncbi:MAG: histidine triad nucleotide-binding protein [Rubrobacteraceae bacterium]
MANESDCIFCKIAAKELDADIVLEDDEVVVFHDINGRAPVHVLVIPRQHVESLGEIGDLPDTTAKRLFGASQEVAEKLGIAQSGYAVRLNNGRDAGQEVFHLHLHVLGGEKIGMP